SALLASLTIWACGTTNRVGAGVAFGLIASVKPQLVLMAPLMLALDRDWKAFVSAGLAFVAAVLLALVLYGPGPWSQWVASMGYFHEAVVDLKVLSSGVSPALVAER